MDSFDSSNTSDTTISTCSEVEDRSEVDCEQWICGICISIMRFPVTLPCGHDLCLHCFRMSKEFVNLLCPFCRHRISCWARKTKNIDNNLIDWEKWNLIQKLYPELADSQPTGHQNDDQSVNIEDFDDLMISRKPVHRVISSSGEIHREYEEFCQMESDRQLAEEEASQRLIEKLLAEDQTVAETPRRAIEDTTNDEIIARALQGLDHKGSRTLRNRTLDI